MKEVRVGLIGYGGIVRKVLAELPRVAGRGIGVTGVLVRPGRCDAARQALGGGVSLYETLDSFVTAGPTIVAECAGHTAVDDYGDAILRAGIDLMVVSIGSLSDRDRHERLVRAAREGGAHLILPSGAIGAVDALSAARIAGLTSVTYRSRKPPAAWTGTPAESLCDLGNLSSATTFYQGDARDAARLYPRNANVAATVALAGIGFDDTQVELCADPTTDCNIHEIEAEGVAGSFRIELKGNPIPENLKTSMLTALSVARGLANMAATTVI